MKFAFFDKKKKLKQIVFGGHKYNYFSFLLAFHKKRLNTQNCRKKKETKNVIFNRHPATQKYFNSFKLFIKIFPYVSMA